MSSQKSTLIPVLRFAHQLVRERVNKGDVVIDATLGNGHDTLLLAQLVGESGLVMSFDVQTQAFEKSQLLLEKHQVLSQVRFVHDSHAHLCQHWEKYLSSFARIDGEAEQLSSIVYPPSPKVIMFNLGYLPGADKRYTTQVSSTLEALTQSLALLSRQGLLLVVVYPGHPEGAQEDKAVGAWASQLDQREFQVLRYGFVNQINSPPYLLAIEKLVA